jgi:hypothetical protein
LVFISNGTWIPDPTAGRVHVTLEVTATSRTVDAAGRRPFFAGMQMTLPLHTTAFAASDAAGQPLAVSVKASTSYGVVVFVAFRQRVYSGAVMPFELRFDLSDAGGSTNRDLNISPDVLSFPVSAFGSPEEPGSSVSVIFPQEFSAQEQFGDLISSTNTFGQRIFSATNIPDATAINAWFTASRFVPAADFRVRETMVGPIHVTLRYWASDVGWANQVARVLQSGYPVLRAMIGLGDPTPQTLTVEEATTGGIGGFSGEYDQTRGMVEISYFADPIVILHEAVHLWFNDNLTSDRWIDEGFATYYAEQAVLALGLPDHAPRLGSALLAVAVPLTTWKDAGDPSSATEAFLYAGSLEAATEIATLAGQDGLRRVWVRARAGLTAYQPAAGDALPVQAVGTTDWRRLLDLLQETTGKDYTAIWRKWVATAAEASGLDDRAETRADFYSTQAGAGGWNLPPDVRRAMDGWQFATARELLIQVRDILGQRAQIEAGASAAGVTPPSILRTVFETVGTNQAAAEASLELDVLSAIDAARQAKSQSGGATLTIGLIGTNPDADLASAGTAFEVGQTQRAALLAEDARAAWVGAASKGEVRILGLGVTALGLVLLIVVLVWSRTGRRRKGRSPVAGTGEGAAGVGAAGS